MGHHLFFTLLPVFLLSTKGLLLFLSIWGIEFTVVIVVHPVIYIYIYIYLCKRYEYQWQTHRLTWKTAEANNGWAAWFLLEHILTLNHCWPLQFSMLVYVLVFDTHTFCLWFGKMEFDFSSFLFFLSISYKIIAWLCKFRQWTSLSIHFIDIVHYHWRDMKA